jgi:lipoprotein-releasing system permease protein
VGHPDIICQRGKQKWCYIALLMGFPLELALRYMRSKKRGFVSVGTAFAVIGVALGVAALTTVIAVTGGFRKEFRDKVLGVNAHVLILKYSSDFREYRDLMEKMKGVPGVTGIAPFVINPMMVTHKERTATGVLLKGVDPKRVDKVLDLPRHIVEGDMKGLRLAGSEPPERRRRSFNSGRSTKKGTAFDDPPILDDSSEPAAEVGKQAGNTNKDSLLREVRKAIAEDEAVAKVSGRVACACFSTVAFICLLLFLEMV